MSVAQFLRSIRRWWRPLPCWVATLLITLPAPGLLAQTCGAAGGDNRAAGAASCESDVPEPASHPGVGPATATTNSIDLVTGNKYLRAIDVAWPGGLVLARHYNSRNVQPNGLGTAWTHSFDTRLAKVRTRDPGAPSSSGAGKGARARWEVQVMQADGRRIVFTQRVPAGKKKSSARVRHWEPIEMGHGQIREDSRALVQERFVWSWQDGRQLYFDDEGRLTRVELPEGDRLSLQWSDNTSQADTARLLAVVTATGATLRFEYSTPPPMAHGMAHAMEREGARSGSTPRLVAVVHPDGLRTRYAHDTHGQLAAVSHAGADGLTYRYEDDSSFHRLTEVRDANGRILARFAYDAAGRAIESSLVDGHQAIRVEYRIADRQGGEARSSRGETLVSDATGAVTRYRWHYEPHLHRARIESARGPGCAVCPPANVERLHDTRGRLVQETHLDSDRRLRWHYDAHGRPQRITLIEGVLNNGAHNRGALNRGARTGLLPAQRLPDERRARYVLLRYLDTTPGAPLAALARSSVAPGRQTELRWLPGADGRVAARAESGWRPRVGTVDQALLAREWEPIERTLAAQAPPIPTHRFITTSLQAAPVLAWANEHGIHAAWLVDDFGLQVAELDRVRGVVVHRYDRRGNRTDSLGERSAHHVATHDDLGRVTSRGPADDPAAVQVRHEGRHLVTVSDPMHTRALLRDGGGRVIAEANLLGPRAQGVTSARLFVTTHRFDARGRLIGQTLPNGHALGFAHSPQGHLLALAWRTPAGATRMILEQAAWHPDALDSRGLESLVFGNGLASRFSFDSHGRMTRVQHRSVATGQPSGGLPELQLVRGAGNLIRRIDHDGAPNAYVHDQRGRLIGAADEAGAEGFAYSPEGERIGHYRSDESALVQSGQRVAQPAALDFTPDGQLRGVTGEDGVRTRYWYDSRGWRLAKVREHASWSVTYFVYRDDRLVGEADARGHLTAWYIRIGERPIAVLRFDRDPQGEVFWLHGDHLGTPLAATDVAGRVRWSARYRPFGERRAAFSTPAQGFLRPAQIEVPLRMPGHYHDEESGLHYNLHRYYDPRRGAYLTPDPLGVLAGAAPYMYVGADPLGAIDPTGLYQNDVHFFMTYFLARTAGLGANTALTVASAAQYIDDNPFTRPLPVGSAQNGPVVLGGVADQVRRLAAYHFTQDTFDPAINVGEEPQDYALRRVLAPRNPQITTLLGYANENLRTVSNPGGLSACARAQFFGEYLHAFQDTFSHRSNLNAPIGVNGGFGHLAYGTAPDVTFNTIGPGGLRYELNEYRTFVMEQAVFALFQQNFGRVAIGPDLTPITFTLIEPVLHAFNATEEASCLGEDCWPVKLALLDAALERFDLGDLPVYDARDAQARRAANLRGLDPARFPNAILDTPQR